jgi:hypothetical protein
LEICGDDFGFFDGFYGAVRVFEAVTGKDADDFGVFEFFEISFFGEFHYACH